MRNLSWFNKGMFFEYSADYSDPCLCFAFWLPNLSRFCPIDVIYAAFFIFNGLFLSIAFQFKSN
jgi:hypothetical protein